MFWQQIINRRTRTIVRSRGHVSDWFVQQKINEFLCFNDLAIDSYVIFARDLGCQLGADLAIHGNSPRSDELFSTTAGGPPAESEKMIEADGKKKKPGLTPAPSNICSYP